MKKKILTGAAAIAIVLVAAFNVDIQNNADRPSELVLTNIEALASDEEPDKGVTCDGTGSVICPIDNTQVRKVTIWG